MKGKTYRTIKRDNGTIKVYAHKKRLLHRSVPDWNRTDVQTGSEEWYNREESYFILYGRRVYLSTIMSTHNHMHFPHPPSWIEEFDGISDDSWSSGILVKLDSDGDAIKVFSYLVLS